MNTKLTLRIDEELVRQVKEHAAGRDKSVSQMFSEFVVCLGSGGKTVDLPPITRSLRGVLKGRPVLEEDYRRHLQEKHA